MKATVKKLKGKENELTITVTTVNLLGETKDYTAVRRIRNNAAGTCSVGWYSAHVATEGNTRISEAHVVN